MGFKHTFGVYVTCCEDQEQGRNIKNLESVEFVGDSSRYAKQDFVVLGLFSSIKLVCNSPVNITMEDSSGEMASHQESIFFKH